MIERFKTLFFVKSSLISLYLALTIPIPFIAIDKLKNTSIFIFIIGLFTIISLTSDYVQTCDKKISYKTSLISKTFGRKNWEIYWKDIRSIKSLPTSQGSKVYYFNTSKDDNFLMPQRIENFEQFLSIISKKTGIDVKNFSYLSPLWTYKLLTSLSILMVIGEILGFKYQMLSMLNL